MEFGRSRAILPGAAMAVFLVAGGAGAKTLTPTPCNGKPQNNIIEVTSTGVGCDVVHVSKKAKNWVKWQAKDPAKFIKATWKTQNPFETSDCDGTKNVCKAYGIVVAPDVNKKYGYGVSLCDHGGTNCKVVVDPGVIINP
jgi:hypothetical protein